MPNPPPTPTSPDPDPIRDAEARGRKQMIDALQDEARWNEWKPTSGHVLFPHWRPGAPTFAMYLEAVAAELANGPRCSSNSRRAGDWFESAECVLPEHDDTVLHQMSTGILWRFDPVAGMSFFRNSDGNLSAFLPLPEIGRPS